jgi:hypothetical protein
MAEGGVGPNEIVLVVEGNSPKEPIPTNEVGSVTKPDAPVRPCPPRIVDFNVGCRGVSSPTMMNRKHREQSIKVGSTHSFDVFRPSVFFDVREFGGEIQSNPKKKILVITGRHIFTVDERNSNMCRVSLKLSLKEIREITFKEHRHTSVRVGSQSVMWFTPLAKELAKVISEQKSKCKLSPSEALQLSELRAHLPTTLDDLKAWRRQNTVDSVSYVTRAIEHLTSNCFSRRRKHSQLYEGLPTVSPR